MIAANAFPVTVCPLYGASLWTSGLTVETIPAAEWAVFTINSRTGFDNVEKAYSRILTEWFPHSQYSRDESVPHFEVFPGGNADSPDYEWEIWIPVK